LPKSYDRWLSLEPDPRDLLITYPSEPMTIWPISTRVNILGGTCRNQQRFFQSADTAQRARTFVDGEARF
jgi:putative SOS response-associated peptidase YedK